MLAGVLIITNGCKKSKDGATGPAGANGTNGTNGTNGNANVVAHTFTVSTWSSTSSYYYTQLAFPELNATNINSAAVEVFFGTAANTWTALPYTYVSTINNYFMGFITSVSTVEVRWTCNSSFTIGSDPNSIFSTTVQVKVVVIPPGMKKPNVNYHSYEEIKAAHNL